VGGAPSPLHLTGFTFAVCWQLPTAHCLPPTALFGPANHRQIPPTARRSRTRTQSAGSRLFILVPANDSFRVADHSGVAVASIDTCGFVVPYLQSEDIVSTLRRRYGSTIVLGSVTSMANGSFQRRGSLETSSHDARNPIRYNINARSRGRFEKRQTKNAEENRVHGRHWRKRLHLC
jgi:hypothetical protein